MPTNTYEYMHKYYIERKEHFKDMMKEKISCKLCGKVISRGHMSRHHDSKNCSHVLDIKT